MCLNPSYIKNRKYIPNKKNGGVIPPVSANRVLIVPVGCGVCIECKKQKSRSWQIRLKEDIKRYFNGKVVARRMSGEMNTSLGNGFGNLMMMTDVCLSIGIELGRHNWCC